MPAAFLRLALAIAFLSAVADRFGFWGPHGNPGVAWGDMDNFTPYVSKLNPWFPAALIPTVAWAATVAEIALGILLLIGFKTQWTACLSALLLFSFAIGMTVGIGLKAPLDYSVLTAAAAAFLLARTPADPWTLDHRLRT